MLDFSNTKIAFQAKSDCELLQSKLLFTIVKNKSMVKLGKFASNIAIKIHFPISWIVKPTLYKHFVGGETPEECNSTINELMKYGVESILDYSAEGAEGEFYINRTFNETLKSIEYAGKTKGIPYAVFKPSGLCRFEVLEKASANKKLTHQEQSEYDTFKQKMNTLAKKAYDKGVRLLVDAEHYSTQQAFDDVVNELMSIYNKERAIVFNTLQMYRHDRYEHLITQHLIAREKGYTYGVKFVRGAYMDEEREQALKHGYLDPICPNKQATDDNFDKANLYCLRHVVDIEFFCGTHNEHSNLTLAQAIHDAGLDHNDSRIYFSQLYGMSDNISFSLASENYRVAKYLPYGPIKEVLPYLIRRAEENTMVEGQTLRELSLINQEYKRRKKEK